MDETVELKKLLNDGKLDSKLFKQECSGLKNALATTLQHKKNKQAFSCSSVAKHVLALKAINRRTQLRIKDLRDITYQKKLAVDQKTRQLQNLLYELGHLKETVQSCLELRSLHDEINLIPEDEYITIVGESTSSESTHERTLNRLYWELEQRKKLDENLNDVSKAVAEVKQRIAAKQAYLEGINKNLQDILEATRKTDSEMGLNVSEIEESNQLAFNLPSPLYIIFSRLSSYADVNDLRSRIKVKIVGDVELARAVNVSGAPTTEEADVDTSEVDDQDNVEKKKTHRKSKRSGIDEPERSQHRADSLHPLSVVVTVTTGSESKWPNVELTLSFGWLLRTKMVTVRDELSGIEEACPLSQSVRDHLFSECLLSHLPCGEFTARWNGEEAAIAPSSSPEDASSDRTYAWAQLLGGLQCLPDLPTSGDATLEAPIAASASSSKSEPTKPFGFVQIWFEAICRRIEARLSLNEEVYAIENKTFKLTPDQKPFFVISPEVTLTSWDRTTFDEVKMVSRAQTFIALNLIQPKDTFFKCKVAYNGKDVLSIGISVPACYPDVPSQVFLDPAANSPLTPLELVDLETTLNCYLGEMPREDGSTAVPLDDDANNSGGMEVDEELNMTGGEGGLPGNLLTCQLARIASLLPMLAAATGDKDAIVKATFPQNASRYRTKSSPLKWIPRFGSFSYR